MHDNNGLDYIYTNEKKKQKKKYGMNHEKTLFTILQFLVVSESFKT